MYTTTTNTNTIISATSIATATPTAAPIITLVLLLSLVPPAAPAGVIEVDGVVRLILVIRTDSAEVLTVDVDITSGNGVEVVDVVIKLSNVDVVIKLSNVDVEDIDVDVIDIVVDNT